MQFEVILTNYFMKTKGEIVTAGIDYRIITSYEGFKTIPHTTLKEVNISDVDLFLIPGGQPDILLENKDLHKFLVNLNSKNKIIAAICAAPIHLAKAGILNLRKFTTSLPVDEFPEFNNGIYVNESVVVDDNIVTAKPNGYVDFAIEIGKIMNIYKDETDLEETIQFFKYFKDAQQ